MNEKALETLRTILARVSREPGNDRPTRSTRRAVNEALFALNRLTLGQVIEGKITNAHLAMYVEAVVEYFDTCAKIDWDYVELGHYERQITQYNDPNMPARRRRKRTKVHA